VKDLFDQVNSGEEEYLIALFGTVVVEDAAKMMKIVEREEEVESEERELCEVLPAAAEVERLSARLCSDFDQQVFRLADKKKKEKAYRLFKVSDDRPVCTFGTVSELLPNIVFLVSCRYSHSFRSILIESDNLGNCLRMSSLFFSGNSCVLQKLLPFFR